MSDEKKPWNQTNRGPNRPQSYSHPGSAASLPVGYLADGYYDAAGLARKELFLEWPEKIASAFKEQKPRLSQSSIRNFYNEVKTLSGLVRAAGGEGLGEHGARFYMLKSKARYYANKADSTVPELLCAFIERNIEHAEKSAKHLHLFSDHFMCVVANLK